MSEKLSLALGPRDNPPEPPVAARRAMRAQRNLEESLPFFLTFALLLLFTAKADGVAILGAQIFLSARLVYLPAYMMGRLGVRSLIWVAGSAGLVIMLVRLLGP